LDGYGYGIIFHPAKGENMKKLVVYYSLSGNTEKVAETIARELKADICRVEEVKKRSKFLQYILGGFAAGRDKSCEIKPIDIDVHDYDLILLGSPVWAAKPVPAINAFIYGTEFKKKKVIAFFTMGGSEYEKAKNNITAKIHKRQGVVTDCFGIRTGRRSHDVVIKETKKVVKKRLKHLG
jgi:flavodoxin